MKNNSFNYKIDIDNYYLMRHNTGKKLIKLMNVEMSKLGCCYNRESSYGERR